MEHSRALTRLLADFASKESLPAAFVSMAKQWYCPLAEEISKLVNAGQIKILGISGTQGSGKSTLAGLLVHLLKHQGLNTLSLSLDDFYLTRAERQRLAHQVHPLFATRGVPGTHDLDLATTTVRALFTTGKVNVPRFDKTSDDRLPESQWESVQAPIDLVIIEGWCLSVPPQSEDQLTNPINTLEAEQDPDGIWRKAVNKALTDYQDFFQLIDFLVYLRSPSFDVVKQWRGRQEQKLAAATAPNQGVHIMDEAALSLFLQHYQRITLHSFETLPTIANVMFTLNEEQNITQRTNRL